MNLRVGVGVHFANDHWSILTHPLSHGDISGSLNRSTYGSLLRAAKPSSPFPVIHSAAVEASAVSETVIQSAFLDHFRDIRLKTQQRHHLPSKSPGSLHQRTRVVAAGRNRYCKPLEAVGRNSAEVLRSVASRHAAPRLSVAHVITYDRAMPGLVIPVTAAHHPTIAGAE
jgi:hypothetical protein